MSEQQYRVIVPGEFSAEDVAAALDPFTRVHVEPIERPVPTTDRPDLTRDQFTNDESYYLATGQRPSLPTREQIAEALWRSSLASTVSVTWEGEAPWLNETTMRRVDALLEALTLLQKGADQ